MLRNPENKHTIRRIRPPAVADMFYPANPRKLAGMVKSLLEAATPSNIKPVALISPHAGYIYSGPITASAFAPFYKKKYGYKRIFLMGPSHRVSFKGFALPDSEIFETPLGRIPLDMESIRHLQKYPRVQVLPDAHRDEHSLEVQLPFIQTVFTGIQLIPVLTGACTPEETARLIGPFLDDPESLVIVSSDLSHYYDYATANQVDRQTAGKIKNMEWEGLLMEQACGSHGIAGLLLAARERNLHPVIADLRNSGDTSGHRNQVVGYGAFFFTT